VMPDFGYWSWPIDVIGEYTQVRQDIIENEPEWTKKVPKAVWRGSTKTNVLREALVNVSKGRSWSDVEEISWENVCLLNPYLQNSCLTSRTANPYGSRYG
jgi:hypothetical protein